MKPLQSATAVSNGTRSASLVRCAIYTRVSTDDQARGDYSSLDTQRDICRHAIALHQHEGWSATHFFDDAGFSGKNLERPAIQALLHAVRSGEIKVVVAYKLDRITRSLPDFYALWKVLEQHGVHFVSATQSFDTSNPMGMLMVNMLLSFAQFERETTVERVRHKLGERAKRGMWNGGWAPLGYTYDAVTKKVGIHEGDAPVARRIFELSRDLGSTAKVAALLNAEGLRTPSRQIQSRRGRLTVVGDKRFICNKITSIVTNPFYKGIIRHGGEEFPGEHPALVSAKLWQQANDALSGKTRPGGNPKDRLERNLHQSLLKGIIRCGICGHRLTPKAGGKKDRHGRQYLYYMCNEVSKEGKAASCTVRNVPGRTLDEFVLKIIGELGRHPELIRSAIAASNEEKSRSLRPLKKRRAELQQRRKEMDDSLARYLMLARQPEAGHFGEETLAAAEDLSKQKHELERELEKVEIEIAFRERVVADEHRIAGGLRQFDDAVKELSFEEQCELVRLIVRGIRVNRLDPEKEPIPGGLSPAERKIRTQWYSVNLDVFANDLLPAICVNPELGSHFDQNGRGVGTLLAGVYSFDFMGIGSFRVRLGDAWRCPAIPSDFWNPHGIGAFCRGSLMDTYPCPPATRLPGNQGPDVAVQILVHPSHVCQIGGSDQDPIVTPLKAPKVAQRIPSSPLLSGPLRSPSNPRDNRCEQTPEWRAKNASKVGRWSWKISPSPRQIASLAQILTNYRHFTDPISKRTPHNSPHEPPRTL